MKNPIFILSLVLVLFFLFGCDEVRHKADDAADAKNPSLCKELKDEDDVKKCYSLVAKKMDEPNVCLQSTAPNDCVGDYSVEKQSIKYCDLIKDEAAKYGCIVRVTGDQTGRALEQILQDWRGNGTVKKCKDGCEATKSVCTEAAFQIWTKAKEDCFKNNPTDTNDRIWCEDTIKKTFDNQKFDCWDKQDGCNKDCEQ